MQCIITISVCVIFLINAVASTVENDGFIVDENDEKNSLSPHAQQGISKIKKSSLKPVVRSMAMSSIGGSFNKESTAKSNIITTVNKTTDNATTTTSKLLEGKHIEPSIGLEQSLKNLDLVASKREEIHQKDVSHLILHPSSAGHLLPSNITTRANATQQQKQSNKVESAVSQKKSASPNMLTNATITGFLANNPKFTIDSVGTQQQNKKTANDEKTKKIADKKSTNVITVRDQVAKVTTERHQILRIANDPMIAASKKDLLSDNKAQNNNIDINNKLESSSTIKSVESTSNNSNKKNVTKTESSPSTASTSSVSKNNTDSKITKSNIHIATEEDFNKLRYIKRKEIEENAVKKEIVSTHFEAECNEEKKCPKNKYCRNFHCFEAHRKHHECDENDECADDMPCIYGRCDDKPKGSPGSICDKDGDCGDGCCVIEPTIDERHGTCKNKLEEFHQCSPVLFRKVWIGDEKPECGPCADGLECVERGIHSSHLICMKKK